MLRRLNTEHRNYVDSECGSISCPAVYELTESPQNVRVQGIRITDMAGVEGFDAGSEAVVEIPTAVLLEAAAKLSRQS